MQKRGSLRLALAAGTLVAAVALWTAAFFTDFANVNFGNGTDGSGIGANNRFNIQVVGTDANGNPQPGTWQEADTVDGASINIPGADTIIPGDTVSVEIPFRNESPSLKAVMKFSLLDRPGHASDRLMRDTLQYTVQLDNNTALVTDVKQDQVKNLSLGTLAAGESHVLKVSVKLPKQPTQDDDNKFNGLVSYVQAHFDAQSDK
ncbi:MAG: hypothetical protein LBR21_10385 [Propionibacteriaceae bacterium]|jgi:hypothetical protein|nr:hypothetical protein [Propionibacteriaceae bacterium]